MSALAPLALDDVAFRDLADAAIERIPAESGGQWTLHAPVDPGITLLELLAYLLDQRVYWLDQVPAATVRGILRLLGETPAASRAATTVMRLADEAAPDAVRDVASGVRLTLAGSDPEIEFTTAAGVLLLPVGGVGLEAAGSDRSEDLARGRGVELLPADGGPGEARVELRMTVPPAPPGGAARAALLFRLATQTLGPDWLAEPGERSVAPPARITWAYRRTGATHPATFAPGAVLDGTGGLRRPGIVRFAVPADWEPDGPAGADGRTPFSLWLRTERATFTAPPRALEIVPNVVVARHLTRERADTAELEEQVGEWLPLPGRSLDCDAPGLLVEHERSVRLSLRERDGRWRRWRATPDLAFHGPQDRVFAVDRGAGMLRFGDGLTGRQPVLGAAQPRARLSFLRGAGPSGNVGAARSWEAPTEGLTAHNPVEAAGGREPEALEAARERVAAALARRERAVTGEDHETIAESTPGVEMARAHAAIGFHPAHPCTPVPGAVTVFVVPDAPRDPLAEGPWVAAPRPDPGALDAVARRLEAARLLGSELFVLGPRYRGVRIGVTVGAAGVGAELRDSIERALRDYLDPLVGGDEGEGWPFGEPLRPSALLRRAQAAAGSGADVAAVAVGVDGAPPDESCRDVTIGEHDLVVADSVELRAGAGDETEAGLR